MIGFTIEPCQPVFRHIVRGTGQNVVGAVIDAEGNVIDPGRIVQPGDPMSTFPIFLIKRLPHGADLPLPAYGSPGAAGMDLRAAIPADKPVLLRPMSREIVPTGIAIALKPGWEAQVRPRSGLSAKYGLIVVNSPGTVDSDYRGEIKIILANLGHDEVTIRRGDRIAQLVMAMAPQIVWTETEGDLDETARGLGGFGSTGVK